MARYWRVPAALFGAFALCAVWMWLLLLYVSVDPAPHVPQVTSTIIPARAIPEPTRYPRITTAPSLESIPMAKSARTVEDLNRRLELAESALRKCQAEQRKRKELQPHEPARPPPTSSPVAIPRSPERLTPRGASIPVLVFTYNRPQRLMKCLVDLAAVMPAGFQLFVSQDGDSEEVATVIQTFRAEHPQLGLQHIRHQRDDSGAKPEEIEQGWEAYYAISHHYQSSIANVFSRDASFSRVILLEDDIEVSKDFFDYMRYASPLFDRDPTLYCISGFNDNGKPEHVSNSTTLYRSDFFPGLGWMMSKAIWTELSANWPKGFWDDWMRQPDKRKGRSCIRPEVPRSKTGCSDVGVSNGQFCAEHLQSMRLADEMVDWAHHDFSYLIRPAYDTYLSQIIKSAKPLRTVFEVETVPSDVTETKILYRTNDDLVALEQQVDVMTDFKDGVPRTAYRGIVSLRFKGKRLHLVPTKALYVYD